jgi:hypothetical protein
MIVGTGLETTMKIKRSIVETIEVPDDVDVEDAIAMLSNPPSEDEGDEDDGEDEDDGDEDADVESDADDTDTDEVEESDA